MSDSGDFDRETSYQSLDKRGLWLNKISYHKASSLNVSNSVRRSRSFGAGDIRRSRSFGAVDKRKGAVVTGERDEVGKGKIAIEIRPKMESSNSLVSVAERAEIRSRQRHANLRQKSQSSFEEQRKIFENNNNEASEKLHQNSLTSISSLRNDNNRKQSASDIISKIRQKQRLTSPNPSLTSIGMRGSVSREPVISHKTRETSLSDQENNCVIGKNASKVTIKTAHSRPVKFLPPESRSTVQSRQPGKSGTPSVTYQGAQQQHSVNSGSGSALRTKQNQQWPDHEGDQPDQERTISVVSERVKTLTLHSQKENHKQPGSSFHTGPRSAMFSSDKVGPKTSYRQEQRKAAKFSAQREKPQQNTRGEIYFPTKGHEHHTVDVDRTSDVSTGGIQRARTAGSNNSNVRQFTSKRGVKTTTKHSHSGGTERNNNNVHWATDSTSGSSEEDHIIDTDSSACNVIDERRRRRLVKRAKKRQSRGKKEEDRLQSQVSRFVEREIPHADSQASESGDDNLSRTSSIEVADVLSEDLMSPDEEKTKTKVKENYRANYRKAKQVFETNAPPPEHQIGPSSDGVNISSNPENSPVFARNRLANNIDNVPVPAKKSTGSKPCKENVMSQHNSLTSFSAFEMEAKNAKSKQQFNQIAKLGGSGSFTSVNKVAKITIPSFNSRLRSFSLGKKNIHSDTESYTSRIITSPFTTPSRKFRDMDERYSDGEHELTSRLEKAEQGFESDQGDWQFDLRRCNTLPRNMARDIAKNMQENPFQLSLPSRIRKEHTELLSNSQGTIENKVNLSSSPFTLSNPPNLKIQSKSTGSIEVNRDEFDKEIIQPKMKEEELSVESASTLTIEDSKESSGVTGVSKSSNTLESNQDLAMTYDEIGDEILRIANLVGSDRAFSPTIDNFSPNFEPVVPIIAPPDNFKDTPDVPLSSTSPPEKRESISEEQKSSPRSQRRGRPPPLPSQNSFELEIERDRADSPRRRPSYVIAQSSDLSVLPDFEKGDVIAESEESLISERTEGVGGMTGEQKDKRVSIGKRSRPRIPSVLDPLKAEDDHEKSSTGKWN